MLSIIKIAMTIKISFLFILFLFLFNLKSYHTIFKLSNHVCLQVTIFCVILAFMFRQMRRNKQQLSFDECVSILEAATSGTLAVSGDDGYPYAVPLSYVYVRGDVTGEKGATSERNATSESDYGTIYFHCASVGHKIDAIKRSDKVSFCVIGQDKVIPLEYTTLFKSVIAFGRIRIIEDESEKRHTIEVLAKRYAPDDSAEHRNAEIERDYAGLCMLEMKIEHITGKQSKHLLN